MTSLANLQVPRTPGLVLKLAPPDGIVFSGTITSRDPSQELGGFLRSVHDGALSDGLSELRVDVTALSFVNSSAIRLFVDWGTWVKTSKGYRLRFVINRRATWQKTSFMALLSLVKDALVVEEAD